MAAAIIFQLDALNHKILSEFTDSDAAAKAVNIDHAQQSASSTGIRSCLHKYIGTHAGYIWEPAPVDWTYGFLDKWHFRNRVFSQVIQFWKENNFKGKLSDFAALSPEFCLHVSSDFKTVQIKPTFTDTFTVVGEFIQGTVRLKWQGSRTVFDIAKTPRHPKLKYMRFIQENYVAKQRLSRTP